MLIETNQTDSAVVDSNPRFAVISEADVVRFTKKYPRLFAGFNASVYVQSLIRNSEHEDTTMGNQSFLSKDGKQYYVQLRSDLFIARFIEDCYDQAYATCNTTVSTDRWRRQNGLDLNGYDAFPLIVERFLARTYSLLDVKQQIMIEIMVTIERKIELGFSFKYNGISAAQRSFALLHSEGTNNSVFYDGQKLVLFTQFLSEENDCDVVALYLAKREILQNMLKLKMKDIHHIKIWSSTNSDTGAESTLQSTANASSPVPIRSKKRAMLQSALNSSYDDGSALLAPPNKSARGGSGKLALSKSMSLVPPKAAEGPKTVSTGTKSKKTKPSNEETAFVSASNATAESRAKIVPLKLPPNWSYLYDVTMPETPLLAFEVNQLVHVLYCVMPQLDLELRKFVAQRLLEHCHKCQYRVEGNAAHMRQKLLETSSSTGTAGGGIQFIPVTLLLNLLCIEYKMVPVSTKIAIVEGAGLAGSLNALSHYYENDRTVIKDLEKKISEAELELNQLQAQLLTNEKVMKKLMKKWNNNTATEAEMDLMDSTSGQLAETKELIAACEGKLAQLKKEQKQQQRAIEDLWNKATGDESAGALLAKPNAGADPNAAKLIRKRKKHISTKHWSNEVNMLLGKVLEMNIVEWAKHKHTQSVGYIAAAAGLYDALDEVKQDAVDYFSPSKLAPHLKKFEEDGNVTASQHYFLIEVLTKTTVHNAIRDGLKRISVLAMGGEAYLREEYAKQLLAEKLGHQKLKNLEVTHAARVLSSELMSGVLEQALDSAGKRLFDTWTLLDLNPLTWIDSLRLERMEDLYRKHLHRHQMKCKAYIFKMLAQSYRVLCMVRRHRRKICARVWHQWREDNIVSRNLTVTVKKIQRSMRCALARRYHERYMAHQHQCLVRAHSVAMRRAGGKGLLMLRHWKQWARLSALYKKCKWNKTDRRFIKTFYTWLHQYKLHRTERLRNNVHAVNCCLRLQCVARMFVANRRVKKLLARAKILRCLRCYVARQKAHQMKVYRRRLEDCESHVAYQQLWYAQFSTLKFWKLLFRQKMALYKVFFIAGYTKCRRSWRHWKKVHEKKMKIFHLKALLIQSVIRGILVRRYILNYYKFSRGLKKAQCMWLRTKCIRQYKYDIYWYRKAKTIQRLYRGYRARSNLTNNRILDIHYAASHNRYERLLYYAQKYPELMVELDKEGNTALHNAAKNASKRTLKLLLRFKMNPNALNMEGYSALHLTIISNAVNRDSCFSYMLEHGFDEDQLTPDGKTCLILAAHYNRNVIMHELLQGEIDTNARDYAGMTAMQTCCRQGNLAMVKELIENNADVNYAGQNGTYPLHDVVLSDNLEIAYELFRHGAYVNVSEPYYKQTPLMWATQQRGSNCEAFVRLYILQGAVVNARDYINRTAAHYAASSDNVGIYNALREADCDFEVVDDKGDTPLHLAAEYGASEFANALLYGGVNCSGQNSQGDQPAHIACRYNQLELLKHICMYDDHIGRVNYSHQTPLGVAKFYGSNECRIYLETNFRLFEQRDTRHAFTGELWWDREIDEQTGDWIMEINPQAERIFRNKQTGEISRTPPVVDFQKISKTTKTVELPLKRNIVLVKEQHKLNKHTYLAEYAEKEAEVAEMKKDYRVACIIQKYMRRKLAYMELKRLRTAKKHRNAVRYMVRKHMPGWRRWQFERKTEKARAIQKIVRGFVARRKFYYPVQPYRLGAFDNIDDYPCGRYYKLVRQRAHRILRQRVWKLWKAYKTYQDLKQMMLIQSAPITLADWAVTLSKCKKPERVVGMYEEYHYPGSRDLHFYRHMTTGTCTLIKPSKMKYLDELAESEAKEIKKFGATQRQVRLVTRLQALFRGHRIRTYSRLVERALNITMVAESKYFSNPEQDNNVYNYALYCLVIVQDLDRARRVFVEALRRMQYRGPDIPFVLYAYAIFALISHDEDYGDIEIIVQRARKAEEQREIFIRQKAGEPPPQSIADGTFSYGKVFILADVGFFRSTAMSVNNAYAWENFAICRFLVYNDFNGSFDAYMEAFKFDPLNKKVQENFDIMMTHFHGKSKRRHDEVVKERLRYHAKIASDLAESRRIYNENIRIRNESAKRIQKWYERCKGMRVFNAFMKTVRGNLAEKNAANNSRQRKRKKHVRE